MDLYRLLVRLAVFVLRIAIRVVWLLITLAVGTVAAWWVGVPMATSRVADEWLKRVAFLPSDADSWVYRGARLLALLTIVLGWIIAARITVWCLYFLHL